ncbi:MAG: DNA alkylation repair protein [Clostridia bacterium]|nr:DNA alkylation repair protein [Clostridia bacterium]
MQTAIQAQLRAMQDEIYKDFQCKLMPTVDREAVIGVRTPQLRQMAKALDATEAKTFLSSLPHRYYEENNLHAFLIERIRDYDECIAALDTFLPHVDNWATCDSMNPKILGEHLDRLLTDINRWLASSDVYAVRFAIKLLMTYFLDEAFDPAYPARVASIKSDEYYINMMIAWYFATALAKQYDAILPYIAERRLSTWIHAKTIQKAIESYRITPAQKENLKTLK